MGEMSWFSMNDMSVFVNVSMSLFILYVCRVGKASDGAADQGGL